MSNNGANKKPHKQPLTGNPGKVTHIGTNPQGMRSPNAVLSRLYL
jgi:hypothetical protein